MEARVGGQLGAAQVGAAQVGALGAGNSTSVIYSATELGQPPAPHNVRQEFYL